MFDRIIAAYGRGLAKALNHPWLTLSVALSTLLLSVLLWVFIPKGFFPVQDNGIIQGTLQAPQSSSFANMAQRQRRRGRDFAGSGSAKFDLICWR